MRGGTFAAGLCVAGLVLVLGIAACGEPSARRPVATPGAPRPAAPAAPAVRPVYVEAPACAATPAASAAASGGARARQVVQSRHPDDVWRMSLSKDGLLATTSLSDRSLKLWSLRDRTLLRTVRDGTSQGHFTDVAWSEGGLVVQSELNGAVEMTLEGTIAPSTSRRSATWVLRPWGQDALPVAASYRRGVTQLVMAGKTHALEEPEKTSLGSIVIGAGDTHAAATAGKRVALWPLTGADAKPETIDVGSGDDVARAVAVGARGEQLLVGVESKRQSVGFATGARTILLTRSGAQWTPRDLPGPRTFMRDVRISPDGSLGVATGYDELVVFDLPSGGVRWRSKADIVRIGRGGAWSVGRNYERALFSPSGASLVVGRVGGALMVLDAKTGRRQGELGAELRRANSAFFTGPSEIAASGDQRLVFWSAESGRVARTESLTGGASLLEGDVLDTHVEEFGGSCGGDAETMSLARWVGTQAPKEASDDDDDGNGEDLAALLGGGAGGAKPKPKPKKKVPPPLWPPARGRVSTVCVPKTRLALSLQAGLALVGVEQSASVLDLRSKNKVALADYHKLFAIAPQITADGAHVIALTGSGFGIFNTLVVWDAKTGRIKNRDVQVAQTDTPAGATQLKGVHRFFRSPDGKRIMLVYGNYVAIHGFPDLREQKTFKTTAPIESAHALDPAGDTWLTGSSNGTLSRVESGAVRAAGTSASGALVSIATDATRARAVTVSEDGTLGVWDAKTAALRATLAAFDDDEHISFTPGGAYTGTAEVSDRVGWVFDGPLEGFRFEQFERAFRKPDVVKARLSGAADDVAAFDARPPRVDVVAAPGSSVSSDVAEVRVRVTSPRRVDAVRAFVEGRPVAARAVCAASGEVSLSLPLMGGSNRVSIVAFDDRGFASNAASFDVTVSGALLAAPELYVIAAGVSKYPRLAPSYQLDLADDDARAIAAAFSAQAGPGKGFSAVHASVLVDEQVTIASLKDALAGLAGMRASDTAIVFLAGHGVKPAADADMVFLTSTADATVAGVKAGGLGWKEIGERLSAAKGRVLVLLDACHSGDLSQGLLVPNGDLAASLVHDQRAGALVFAAAKGRQLSYEGQGSAARGLVLDPKAKPLVTTSANEAHGFFTGALLNALATPATDRNADGVIQISELIDDVIARVSTASDGKQTPWIARRELFGDFAIAVVPPVAK